MTLPDTELFSDEAAALGATTRSAPPPPPSRKSSSLIRRLAVGLTVTALAGGAAARWLPAQLRPTGPAAVQASTAMIELAHEPAASAAVGSPASALSASAKGSKPGASGAHARTGESQASAKGKGTKSVKRAKLSAPKRPSAKKP